MKVEIIPIGNSKGIRIPKALLEQCGFEESAELELNDNQLVLSPSRSIRKGWDKAFQAMRAKGDDQLLETYAATAFDESEWKW